MKTYCVGVKILALVLFAFSARDISAQNALNNVDIHGFVSQGFLYTTENNFLADSSDNGSFEFNELGVNFSTQLSDDLRIGMQLFSRDLGDFDNNEVNIDWAFGDYKFRDWLGFRAGIIKQPGLLFTETRDIDSLRTSVILPQNVYHDSLREAFLMVQGIGVYGNIPMEDLGDLSYQALWGGTNVEPDGGVASFIRTVGPFSEVHSLDFDELYVGYLEWMPPVSGLKFIGSYMFTKADIPVTAGPGLGPLAGTLLNVEFSSVDIFSSGVEYTLDKWTFMAEALRVNLTSKLVIPGMSLQETARNLGWYVSASYRFNDWFELGSYYEDFYPDIEDTNGSELKAQGLDDFGAWQRDLALSTRFDVTSNLIFKLEAHYVDGTSELNPDLNSTEMKQHWLMFASKISYMF